MSWKLTQRQKVIFGYTGCFLSACLVGNSYLAYQYFFDKKPDDARRRIEIREGIVGEKGMKRYVVDGWNAGMGGLRWRNKPFWFHMHADRDFPKNGEVVLGSECDEFPGWLKVWNRPFWLPIKDGNFTYMTPVT